MATRKTKYETHILPNLDRIPKLKKQGYLDEQIARVLGVGVSTFKEYKRDHSDLSDALKKGREELIEDLEDTLYRKALGKCTVKETKKYIEQGKDGKQRTKIEETTKEIPPDTGALVFSLKNLAPERWKDIHETTFKELDFAMENFKTVSDELDKVLNHDDKK